MPRVVGSMAGVFRLQNIAQSSRKRPQLPLSPGNIDVRLEENSHEMHFMILGVIEAAALGAIVYSMEHNLQFSRSLLATLSTFALSEICQIVRKTIENSFVSHLLLRYALSVFTVVLVTFEYGLYQGLFPRYPTYRDVVQPVFLGLAQLAPLVVIKDEAAWWLLSSVFVFVAFVSYINTITRIGDHKIEKQKLRCYLLRGLCGRMAVLLFALTVTICAFATTQRPELRPWIARWILGDGSPLVGMRNVIEAHFDVVWYTLYGTVGVVVVFMGMWMPRNIKHRLES